MEKTRFVENDTAAPIFVAGRMIPPGEGRDVPESAFAPEPAKVIEPVADADAPLRELLGGSVADVKAKLPDLTQEALDRLSDLEGEGKHPRKGVLEALADEKLKRAAAAQLLTAGGAADGNQEGASA